MDASNIWNLNENSKKIIEKEKRGKTIKHGMLASVPLLCQGKDCAFINTCTVHKDDMEVGNRCLLEIGAIMARFEALCKYFKIDTTEEVKDVDVVDVSMIRDIVDVEIQILRAENKIAINGDFMAEHIAHVDRACDPHYEDIVHPAMEYKLKLVDTRIKLLQKLNATRKDKAEILGKQGDYSQKAKSIIDKVKSRCKDIDLDDIEEEMNNECT